MSTCRCLSPRRGVKSGYRGGTALHRIGLLLIIGLATMSWLGCRANQPDQGGEVGLAGAIDSSAVHLRVNLLGYLEDDSKPAVAFSHQPVEAQFDLVDAATDEVVFTGALQSSSAPGWGTFAHYYQADFSTFDTPGRYYLRVGASRTPVFGIGRDAYGKAHEELLGFMRQQRCGYNPFLDMVCHQRDGRTSCMPKGTTPTYALPSNVSTSSC